MPYRGFPAPETPVIYEGNRIVGRCFFWERAETDEGYLFFSAPEDILAEAPSVNRESVNYRLAGRTVEVFHSYARDQVDGKQVIHVIADNHFAEAFTRFGYQRLDGILDSLLVKRFGRCTNGELPNGASQ